MPHSRCATRLPTLVAMAAQEATLTDAARVALQLPKTCALHGRVLAHLPFFDFEAGLWQDIRASWEAVAAFQAGHG